jgi:hypothetical protein
MAVSFALCILGLLLGMLYSLYESFIRHKDLEAILSRSIPYYKALGGLGILGMLLFFVFLILQIFGKGNNNQG